MQEEFTFRKKTTAPPPKNFSFRKIPSAPLPENFSFRKIPPRLYEKNPLSGKSLCASAPLREKPLSGKSLCEKTPLSGKSLRASARKIYAARIFTPSDG